MKTSALKAKGRRLQKWTAEQISKLTGIPWGKDELIEPREMGQSGVDVKLIGEARDKFPFSIECKNQETWHVPKFIRQAKENTMPGTDWLLIMSRNDTKPVVVMDAVAFFRIMKDHKFKKRKTNRLIQK